MIKIFTDGACAPNPGMGAYGFIIIDDVTIHEAGGRIEGETTNNRAEMISALEALKLTRTYDEETTIYSDSNLMVQAMNGWVKQKMLKGWSIRGEWRKNLDLWDEIALEVKKRTKPVHWIWIKGHAGHPGNERADVIATSFRRRQDPRIFCGLLKRHRSFSPREVEHLMTGVEGPTGTKIDSHFANLRI